MMKRIFAVSAVVSLIVFGAYAQSIVSTFKDKRDGKTYRTVKIDKMVWMAENLNYDAKGSKCYDNKAENCARYGRLYDWATALKACPAGFHLPADDEWAMLENSVGGSITASKKLKSAAGWNKNGGGTDEYGFSALPGGYGASDGVFRDAGDGGFWWSATDDTAGGAWSRYMRVGNVWVDRYANVKKLMFSVRCVAD
jgi:uncharacterized protein (TIGR02145 family)